jgi:hypothetical protein
VPDPEAHPHVAEVHLKDDDSVELVVEVVGFNADEWAEISGYIIQQDGTVTPFSAVQKAPPAPAGGGIPKVTVSLPAMDPGLAPGADVTVITRMTKAQIWPTPLAAVAAAGGFKALWQATNGEPAGVSRYGAAQKSRADGSTQGSVASGQVDGVQPAPTMQVNGGPGGASVTATGLRVGTRVTLTIEAVEADEPGDTDA